MIFFKIFFNWTALHLAVSKNNFEIVSFLLKQPKIDVNLKTDWGIFFIIEFWTPLHYAVDKCGNEIVKLLLNHRNINANIGSNILNNLKFL